MVLHLTNLTNSYSLETFDVLIGTTEMWIELEETGLLSFHRWFCQTLSWNDITVYTMNRLPWDNCFTYLYIYYKLLSIILIDDYWCVQCLWDQSGFSLLKLIRICQIKSNVVPEEAVHSPRILVYSRFSQTHKVINTQYRHYCELWIPKYLQFSSLFGPIDGSKYEIRNLMIHKNYMAVFYC